MKIQMKWENHWTNMEHTYSCFWSSCLMKKIFANARKHKYKKKCFSKEWQHFFLLGFGTRRRKKKNKQKQLSERLSGPILHPKNVPNKFFHCRHICNWICCQESYFAHVFWKLRIRERACEIKSKKLHIHTVVHGRDFSCSSFQNAVKTFPF